MYENMEEIMVDLTRKRTVCKRSWAKQLTTFAKAWD